MTIHNSSKALNTAPWAAQVLLAIVFSITGARILFLSMENLYALIPWKKDVNSLPILLIGFSEIVGGLGLILPSLLHIKPQLTPQAATGVAHSLCCLQLFLISQWVKRRL